LIIVIVIVIDREKYPDHSPVNINFLILSLGPLSDYPAVDLRVFLRSVLVVLIFLRSVFIFLQSMLPFLRRVFSEMC
jgi:hypothetical protein